MRVLRLSLVLGLVVASTACGVLLGIDDDKRTGSSASSGSVDSGSLDADGNSAPDVDKGTPLHLFTGVFNSCILSDTGVLACWGSNASGQLAQGGATSMGSNVPLRVRGAPGRISAASIGQTVLCVVADGSLACACASNSYTELGDDSAGRTRLGVLASPTNVLDVAASVSTVCSLGNDASVWCWGRNNDRQAGTDGSLSFVTIPNKVATTRPAARVAVGVGFACAASTGAVECWGTNATNKLGRAGPGTAVPIALDGIDGTVTSLSLGDSHGCVIVEGAARCWGNNAYYALGVSEEARDRNGAVVTPTGMGSGVTSLCAGTSSSCAVQNGELWCWGDNSQGQLGIDSSGKSMLPQRVDVGGPVTEVSCAHQHACALRSDGEVLCWGSNTFGELGAEIPLRAVNTPQRVRWDLL